jgi:DNA-binding CsgD family transcriptional regulator
VSTSQLTQREIEIVRLLFEGRKPRQISSDLRISHNTVRQHVKWIYRKLGVVTLKQLFDFYSLADLPILERNSTKT